MSEDRVDLRIRNTGITAGSGLLRCPHWCGLICRVRGSGGRGLGVGRAGLPLPWTHLRDVAEVATGRFNVVLIPGLVCGTQKGCQRAVGRNRTKARSLVGSAMSM